MSLRVDAGVVRGDFSLDVGFEATEGETLVVVGPNGAGKSTLIAMLAGLQMPTRGTVALGDRTLDDVAVGIHLPAAERDAGVLFQDLRLFPRMSVADNVAFALRARRVGAPQARRRAVDLLTRVGIGSLADRMPSSLSGGEAVTVALARALAAEPRMLLLDEPFASLDARSRVQVRTTLGAVLASFRGVAVLVSHDPTDAMTLGDRVLVVEAGRARGTSRPAEILDDPRSAWSAEFVGLNLFRGRLSRVEPGAGRLSVDVGGEVIVAWPGDLADDLVEGVAVVVRPADVTLSREAPIAGSARNQLHGPIGSITRGTERARVRVGSSPPVVAEVTLGTVDRMALAIGQEVWASFKAVEPRVLLGGDGQTGLSSAP